MLQEHEGSVTAEQIMERLNISRRTVYYDMDKVNEWLADNGLAPVEHMRRAGFRLPESSRTALPEQAKQLRPYEYVLSPKERRAWMAIVLFTRTDAVYMHDLLGFLQVSRMTALHDLKLLRQELAAYGLEVKVDRKTGYVLHGEESDKRKALAAYLAQVMTPVGWTRFRTQFQGTLQAALAERQFSLLVDEARQSELYRLIAECEQSLGMEFTDETVFVLASRLLLFAYRLKQGKTVRLDTDEKAILRRMPEFRGAKQLADGLSRLFEISFPEDEIAYLTMHLLGAKLNRLDSPEEDDPNDGAEMQGESGLIRRLTRDVVDKFEQLACIFFERRAELEGQLFIDLKPAYYRIKYGLEVEHPLLDTMRAKYPEVLELTRRALRPLEEALGRSASDDETAFLAMHFGGWMRRQHAVPMARRKAAIVCVNGISASRMLRLQLEGLFPYLDIVAVLSLREYERFRQPVDLWFSTVQLAHAQAPVFVVNAVLTDREKARLLNEVNRRLEAGGAFRTSPLSGVMEVIRRFADVRDEEGLQEALAGFWTSLHSKPDYGAFAPKAGLSELLPESRVRFVRSLANWSEAIEQAAEPLLAERMIEPRYVRAMIEKVMRLGPYIVLAPGVAIAHAKPEEGVLKTGMSLLLVREGVAFSNEEKHRVHALFVLASRDGEGHLTALAQLTVLLRSEQSRRRLIEADRADRLSALLKAYADSENG